MSVKIRLARHGCSHKPFYHVVAADSRKARNGRFIEKLGYYDPNKNPSVVELKSDRMQYWYERGAETSPMVRKLAKIKNIELKRLQTK